MSGKLIGLTVVAGLVCVVVFVPSVREEVTGIFNKAREEHQERVSEDQADKDAREKESAANARRKREHNDGKGAVIFWEHGASVYHASTDCKKWKGRKTVARRLSEAQDFGFTPCPECDPPTK